MIVASIFFFIKKGLVNNNLLIKQKTRVKKPKAALLKNIKPD